MSSAAFSDEQQLWTLVVLTVVAVMLAVPTAVYFLRRQWLSAVLHLDRFGLSWPTPAGASPVKRLTAEGVLLTYWFLAAAVSVSYFLYLGNFVVKTVTLAPRSLLSEAVLDLKVEVTAFTGAASAFSCGNCTPA